ncbi:hypothetical protein BKA62DRAFT_609936 [Auriculariales sp. MPI-PUGE-AT-0066]|nr:hypothetical protein BKA62DRAFT_609936 [Auriculariales sp. MPI-PUGE-AT-0066]
MGIQSIDAASVHRITSGQVVVDLQTAVKELVENSLDAKATSIEVRFKQYGLASIEVIDNGTGIAPSDYNSVALKHHTSKLATFEDLTTVRTFGFRGEALSSLCGLCASVSVTTATEQEAPMGTVLQLDSLGRVKHSSGKAARQRGTTVILDKIFATLPVRRKDLEKNAKREFGKALSLLQAYALVPCTNENGGVRLSVRKLQLQVSGNGSLSSAMTSIWGPKATENMVNLDLAFTVPPEKSVLKQPTSNEGPFTVHLKGIISKFVQGYGRTSGDRQYIFVNGRPCNLSKIIRGINEIYRTFNMTQVPALILDLIIPTDSCDINVSPDKRTIFLHREQGLIGSLKEALITHFTPSQSGLSVASEESSSASNLPALVLNSSTALPPPVAPSSSSSSVSVPTRPTTPCQTSESLPMPQLEPVSSSENADPHFADKSTLSLYPRSNRPSSLESASKHPIPMQSSIDSWTIPHTRDGQVSGSRKRGRTEDDDDEPSHRSIKSRPTPVAFDSFRLSKQLPPEVEISPVNPSLLSQRRQGSSAEIAVVVELDLESLDAGEAETTGTISQEDTPRVLKGEDFRRRLSPSTLGSATEVIDLTQDVDDDFEPESDNFSPHPPDLYSGGDFDDLGVDMQIDLSLDYLEAAWKKSLDISSTSAHPGEDATPEEIRLGVDADQTAAEELLARTIHKDDFARMEILGQFNLGFIITRLRNRNTHQSSQSATTCTADDLFIVDQHASDERYNFETLQETTKMETQRLLRPRRLELTAADEIIAIDRLNIIRQNGFELVIDEEAPVHHRITLTAMPVSKNTTFDAKDLDELLGLLRHAGPGEMVRCSKVRAMFAMRACRKSVMIGHALNMRQMKEVFVIFPRNLSTVTPFFFGLQIIRHMGEHKGWTCPHGRPTMRHLFNLEQVALSQPDVIDWAKYMER